MTAEIISQQLILWDGYNLTTRLHSFILDRSREALDDTTLGCGNRSNAPGLRTASIQIEGIYDDADYDAALADVMGASSALVSICRNNTEGAVAYFLNAMQASYDPIKGSVGELAGFSANGLSRQHPLCRGTLLFSQEGLDSSDTGAGQELGAIASDQTLYAGLHVLAIDDNGGDTLDVLIESDDNSNFTSATTRITFDQMTDIGSQIKTVAGPITDTHWRPNYTINGSTPAFAAAVVWAKRATPPA